MRRVLVVVDVAMGATVVFLLVVGALAVCR